MLILTRRLGEIITIGEEVKVSVLGIHGKQVRLGIDAPEDVIVHRQEIYIKIQDENRRKDQAAGRLTETLGKVIKKIKK